VQIIQTLKPIIQPSPGMESSQTLHRLPQEIFLALELLPDQLAHAGSRLGYELAARKDPLGDDLSRRARGRSSHVRHKVTDREIDFMPHRGYHRQLRVKDGSRHDFFVESP